MPITDLILLIAQLLPQITTDVSAVIAVLDNASTAIKNAQAGDGSVSAADWAAIDAQVSVDMAALAAAASVSVPAP